MSLIIVKSTGKATRGSVREAREVTVPTEMELEESIRAGMTEVAMIASGATVVDPTVPFLKHCSSCLAMGRQPFHIVNFADKKKSEFTILKDGKPHSQCKKCRTEQAVAWQKKYRDPAYQKNYHKTYKGKTKAERKADAIAKAVHAEPETRINGLDSMFIAIDKKKPATT